MPQAPESPMKHRPLRIIPIPREQPDLKLLAQALLALVAEQRQKRAQEEEAKANKPKEARNA